MVAWNVLSENNLYKTDVYAAIYGPNGNIVVEAFPVNSTVVDYQRAPSVAVTDDGANFVVAWQSFGQDQSDYGVYLREFDSTGTPLTGEVQANLTTASPQRNVSIQLHPDESAIMACWDSFNQHGDNTWQLVCREFALSDLSDLSGEISMGEAGAGFEDTTKFAFLSQSVLLFTWDALGVDHDGRAVHYQRFTTDGQPLSKRIVANRHGDNDQHAPFLIPVDGSNFWIGWQSELQDGDGAGVYARILTNY
jgi:hypothetical protein